jgi:hypothetical protein
MHLGVLYEVKGTPCVDTTLVRPSVCYTNSQLMLYSEIIAVCSEIHTKHINTVRTAQ